MTCREKLKIQHPDLVNGIFIGGCRGCPNQYGYLDKPHYCSGGMPESNCNRCWDRDTENNYLKRKCREPLILEPEDWTEEEWATICKLFGMKEAEWIKVSNYTLETYGIPYTGDENR